MMQYQALEGEIEYLLSAAERKCGNPHDAEDLVQETLLAALTYRAKGGEIRDLRGWLNTVLQHKWNDLLRRKYRQPTIGIGEGFDLVDEDNALVQIGEPDEAEQIRRTVAFLGRLYREVIVRYYMNGESVAEISAALDIPVGTVKSRLHSGREQMKKGMEEMENFSAQSYRPIRLRIANSGNNGINNEPGSLVKDDLLAQNILWAAYAKPLSAEDIAKAIGTPAAYVEPIIRRLVDGELMKQAGNRYYTDFMLSTARDMERYIPAQKSFVAEQFDLLWAPIEGGLRKLRAQNFYQRGTADEQESLALYVAFNCLDYGLYGIFEEMFDARQIFPFRRDGGRWIAFGQVSDGEEPGEEFRRHSYSGERFAQYRSYAGCRLLRLHIYGADGFPGRCYCRFPEEVLGHREGDDPDDLVTRLLYILHSGIDHASVGFGTEYLKLIPWLTDCRLLREENGRPCVNIPILNEAEFNCLCGIMADAKREMWDSAALRTAYADFLRDKKQRIPAHLDSVPLQKQYFYGGNAILFAVIREAMHRGLLHDGKYDEGNQHPCPAFLVIEPD